MRLSERRRRSGALLNLRNGLRLLRAGLPEPRKRGDRLVFCPYDSRPYKEKFTLFSTEAEFIGSENDGFLPTKSGYWVRLYGAVRRVEDLAALPEGVRAVIDTVVQKYPYLIG